MPAEDFTEVAKILGHEDGEGTPTIPRRYRYRFQLSLITIGSNDAFNARLFLPIPLSIRSSHPSSFQQLLGVH
jgi:hypothetical protein